MTLAEFKKQSDNHRKRQMCAVLLPLGFLSLVMFIWMVTEPLLGPWLTRFFSDTAIECVKVVPLALMVVVGLGGALFLSRKYEKTSGVSCPFCAKPIGDFQQIVIASK